MNDAPSTATIPTDDDLILFARAVAEHLDGWGVVEDPEGGDLGTAYFASNDPENKGIVSMRCETWGANAGERLSMCWQLRDESVHEAIGYQVGSAKTIGASASTGPEKVAAQITRRLLPEAERLREAAYEQRDQTIRHRATMAEATRTVAAPLTGLPETMMARPGIDTTSYQVRASFPGVNPRDGLWESDTGEYGEATFTVKAPTLRSEGHQLAVNVELGNLSIEDAVKVAALVETLRK